ncbi:MAG: Mur ligase family protein [Patescibacteria group bacterium]
MTIQNIVEAEAALLPHVPLVAQLDGKDTTLERIRPLMELLGNPQDRLRVIHIAGTSGKTSTAYYMSAMLTAAGQTTGLTVSPHVDSVKERVQINGQPLDELTFCKELGDFLDIVKTAERQPSYFELLYAFAIWIFDKYKVDYAVVETGVGGLYDATNMVTRTDKICVITDIGFDHTHLLGKNLTDITTQKAGIIHDGNHVFMFEQTEEIMIVINQAAKAHKAFVHVISKDMEQQAQRDDSVVMPDYQRHNWLLAKQVYEYLQNRDELQSLTSEVLHQTQKLQIPARMDTRRINDKTLIMDGAHNVQKMTAFVSSFRQLYPNIRPTILIALKDDKEYEALIPIWVTLAAQIITTTFNTTQDLPIKSMDSEILADALRSGGANDVRSIADQDKALAALLASNNQTLIITGSFYLLSQLRSSDLLNSDGFKQ